MLFLLNFQSFFHGLSLDFTERPHHPHVHDSDSGPRPPHPLNRGYFGSVCLYIDLDTRAFF
jgi:hypothetical protein